MWNLWLGCICMSKYEQGCISWQWVLFVLYSAFWWWYWIAYVGHILNNQLADPQTCVPTPLFLIWFLHIYYSELAKHTTLNYLFEVTPDRGGINLPVFDAAYLGNATRFLNHLADGRANVEAKSMSSINFHSGMTDMHVERHAGHWRAPNWIFHQWVLIWHILCLAWMSECLLGRKVKAGEELFLDYGTEYWKDTKQWGQSQPIITFLLN